jgi:hypothetical protein
MNPNNISSKYRRYQSFLGTYSTNMVHLRNPWVIAWWSAAFPGLGHMLLGHSIKGVILIGWEFIINVNANVNLGIYYSFVGEFDMAKEVINPQWLLLYIPTYIFGIWSSYRDTVDINKLAILADRENAPIVPFSLGGSSINYLDKRSPWIAVIWSMLMPGMGHIYVHRFVSGFFVLFVWIVTVYFSNILPSIHYTMIGEFALAKTILNVEWLLFMPSFYGFVLYEPYLLAVEYNLLFKKELRQHLQSNYQHASFSMPKSK